MMRKNGAFSGRSPVQYITLTSSLNSSDLIDSSPGTVASPTRAVHPAYRANGRPATQLAAASAALALTLGDGAIAQRGTVICSVGRGNKQDLMNPRVHSAYPRKPSRREPSLSRRGGCSRPRDARIPGKRAGRDRPPPMSMSYPCYFPSSGGHRVSPLRISFRRYLSPRSASTMAWPLTIELAGVDRTSLVRMQAWTAAGDLENVRSRLVARRSRHNVGVRCRQCEILK
jgi:hypothetical protein